MDSVKTYLISIVAACMIGVVAGAFVQKSPLQKIIRLVSGIVILLVAVVPLLRLDMRDFSEVLSRFDAAYVLDTDQIAKTQSELLGKHVRQTSEDYILRKAEELGAKISAEVTVTQEEYPTPLSVVLTGSVTQSQREKLSEYIQTALGIPAERQKWRLYGASE